MKYCKSHEIAMPDADECYLCAAEKAAEGKLYMEAKCDSCEELLFTYHQKLRGSILVICPKCEKSNHWQSLCDLGPVEEKKK